MSQQVINTGVIPNDGTGDPLKDAFDKINTNFAELYSVPASPAPIVNFTSSTTPVYQISTLYNSTLEIINVGDDANDGTGDPLRTAFIKINNNFASLSSTSTDISQIDTLDNTQNQVVYEIPVAEFTHGKFHIRSSNPTTNDSQDITITAQIVNSLTDVKWSAYGTTFNGNAITRYDMDVSGGNVRLLINPLINDTISHFISTQVTSTASIAYELPQESNFAVQIT